MQSLLTLGKSHQSSKLMQSRFKPTLQITYIYNFQFNTWVKNVMIQKTLDFVETQ